MRAAPGGSIGRTPGEWLCLSARPPFSHSAAPKLNCLPRLVIVREMRTAVDRRVGGPAGRPDSRQRLPCELLCRDRQRRTGSSRASRAHFSRGPRKRRPIVSGAWHRPERSQLHSRDLQDGRQSKSAGSRLLDRCQHKSTTLSRAIPSAAGLLSIGRQLKLQTSIFDRQSSI